MFGIKEGEEEDPLTKLEDPNFNELDIFWKITLVFILGTLTWWHVMRVKLQLRT